MPAFSDIKQFLGGQALGKPTLPAGDLTGKTIIITGGNTGLGLECAKHLARKRVAHLILGCRNLEKGEAARKNILSDTGCETKIEVWHIDLDSYGSVLAFCQRAQSDLPRLDGAIANAGMETERLVLSDGLELTLKINLVSTFMFAFAILPKLQETSSTLGVDTTLTFIGSLIHLVAPVAQLEIPQDVRMLERLSDSKYADMKSRYPLSKLMGHLCFNEFQDVVHPADAGSGQVNVNLVNPGWCSTELGRNKDKDLFERVMEPVLQWTGEAGSRTLVHAVMAGRESNGQFLSECQVKPQSSFVRSEKGMRIQRRLWTEVVEQIEKASPGLTIASA